MLGAGAGGRPTSGGGDVRQFPLWVPTESGPVAAVVTTPEEEPRGIVLTLAGAGRHVAIGSTMSALVSERAAELGLAAVRFDYSGVGDSPGTVSEWRLSDVASAREQACAVMSTVSELFGVPQFAVVGTCYGSRVALDLVANPSCIGAVCLAPPVLEHGRMVNLGRSAGHRRSLSFVRDNSMLRKAVYQPLRSLLKETKLAPGVCEALSGLGHAELVFIYGENDARDDLGERARAALDKALSRLPTEQRERFSLQIVPTGALTTFEVLPPTEQALILDLFLPVLDTWFERAPAKALEPIS